jgi:hypothetical protein
VVEAQYSDISQFEDRVLPPPPSTTVILNAKTQKQNSRTLLEDERNYLEPH